MDKNKQLKLREIGYRINEGCGVCFHGKFPHNQWGTCDIHTYEHNKHSVERSELSIHKLGSCSEYTADPMIIVQLHAYEEFLRPPQRRIELQEVLNAVYAGAVTECEARERTGVIGNGHHMAQKIVLNVETGLLERKLFTKPKT